MTIDIASIRPGGRVSVTLTDGTKIIDSPVTDDGTTFCCGHLTVRNSDGTRRIIVASVDAYAAPTAPPSQLDMLGVIYGERDFYSSHEIATAREVLALFALYAEQVRL